MRWIGMMCSLLAACTWSSAALGHGGDARTVAGPYRLEVLDGGGRALPTYEHRGRHYVLGQHGQRYRIRIRNLSPRRVEAVVSVDGRDAIDGRPASFSKPGYVIGPWGEVTVDGFRVSLRDVAAFRFSSVARSYAAQVGSGRDVGVIGVAIFGERARPGQRPATLRRAPTARDSAPWGANEHAKGDGEGRGKANTAAPHEHLPVQAEPEAKDRDTAGSSARSAAGGALAPSDPPRRHRFEARPGLGTAFAERHHSAVVEVDFRRAHRDRPDAVLAARYDDRQGLLAQGVAVDFCQADDVGPCRQREPHLRETARPFAELPRTFAAPPPGW